ncbi:Plasmodium exported protein (Pm-fam-a like), unknown function [Plasmodium malariae]|nr:Plasmodium exported protein (Pm-fam-a like), unknown function [Plasmodium malariae]
MVDCKYDIKLYLRNFRILVECKEVNDSNIAQSQEEIPNYEKNYEKVLSYDRKGEKQTNTQSRRNSLYDEFNKQYKIQKKIIYGKKKLSRFERTFFKKLDYIDFIRKNQSICNKTYQKLVIKKFGLSMYLPTLVLSWVILAPLGGLIYSFFPKTGTDGENGVSTKTYDVTLFLVLLSILIVILMTWLVFTYMKFRKHRRIVKRKC